MLSQSPNQSAIAAAATIIIAIGSLSSVAGSAVVTAATATGIAVCVVRYASAARAASNRSPDHSQATALTDVSVAVVAVIGRYCRSAECHCTEFVQGIQAAATNINPSESSTAIAATTTTAGCNHDVNKTASEASETVRILPKEQG
jgi:hypothetical protein